MGLLRVFIRSYSLDLKQMHNARQVPNKSQIKRVKNLGEIPELFKKSNLSVNKRTDLHIQHNKVSGIHIPQSFSINQSSSQVFREKKPTPAQVLKRQLTNFDFETFQFHGTDNAIENSYITEKIKEIYNINPLFQIVYKEKSEILQVPFIAFFNKIHKDQIFDILTIKKDTNSKSGKEFPFLTVVKKADALKTYRDKLAVELNKKFGRTVEKKRTTNVKYVKVSWSINQFDLESQKTNEILSLLKKKTKLVVIIDTKEALEKLNLNTINNYNAQKPQTQVINDLEHIKREKILSYLLGLFESRAVIESSKGKISDFNMTEKIIINVSPLSSPSSEASSANEGSGSSSNKITRQEKQKLREIQKKAEIERKRKEFEDSLKKIG